MSSLYKYLPAEYVDGPHVVLAMSMSSLKKDPPIAQGIGIVMLAWALVPSNPYAYYVLLRVVVCGIFVYLAVQAHGLKKTGWTWVLGITAVIYNPFLRVHLNRDIWIIVNVATIILLILTVRVLAHRDGASD